MSTITLDLINDLGLSENSGHSISVKAHDTTGEYEDSVPATLTLYRISGEALSSNVTMTKDKAWAVQGQTLDITLSPAAGFTIAPSVGVFVNGSELYSGFTYDSETGKIHINADRVTGIISVSARGARAVTFSGVGVSSSGAAYVADNSDYSATVSADYGFELPDSITVKVGGVTLPSGNYTWNPETGAILIPQNKITGAVAITVNAGVPVSFDGGSNLNMTGASNADCNSDYSCTLSVKSDVTGYTLPSSVTVKVSDQVLNPSAYSWTKSTGVLIIYAEYITGAIEVTAIADNVPPLAAPTISLNDSILTITPDDSDGEGNQFLLFKDSDVSPAVTYNRFRIGMNEYFCEVGMTWIGWVASAYNTNGFTCQSSSSDVIKNSASVKLSGSAVKGSDQISAGCIYTV